MLSWLRYKLGNDPALEPDRELGFSSAEEELEYAKSLSEKLIGFSDVKSALRKVVDTRNDTLPDLANLTPPYDMRALLRDTPAEKAQEKMLDAISGHLDETEKPEAALKNALTK